MERWKFCTIPGLGMAMVQFADKVQGHRDSGRDCKNQDPQASSLGTLADPLCLPLSSFPGHADGPN